MQEGKDTCITGARHIPFDAERVKEAMDAIGELNNYLVQASDWILQN